MQFVFITEAHFPISTKSQISG